MKSCNCPTRKAPHSRTYAPAAHADRSEGLGEVNRCFARHVRAVIQTIDATESVAKPLVCPDARYVHVTRFEPHMSGADLLAVRLDCSEQRATDTAASPRRLDVQKPQ